MKEMDQERFDICLKYHLGELTEEEKIRFDEKLFTDTALSEELVIVQDIFKGIQQFGDNRLKKQLLSIYEELDEEGKIITDEDIHDHIKGWSEGLKKEHIDSRLATDDDFIAIYNTEKELLESINIFGDHQLRSKLVNLRAESKGEAKVEQIKKTKIIPIRRIIAIAATIAILVTVGIFSFSDQFRGADTFAFSVDEKVILAEINRLESQGFAKETVPAQEQLSEVLKNHQTNNDPKKTLDALKDLTTTFPEFARAKVYYAAILSQQKEYEESVTYFDESLETASLYKTNRQELTFHYGTALIKMEGRIEEGMAILRQIAEDVEHPRNTDAKMILTKNRR